MSFRNLPGARCEENGTTYLLRDPIMVNGQEHQRCVIQTHFIQRDKSYVELVRKYAQPLHESGDILSLSKKIISMCQNNVVEKEDVKIGFWAYFLPKFASSNNHGIATDEPYKLQLAIDLVGLSRILLTSFCSAVTKLFGIHGVFYEIAGHGIDGIDGFYMGSSSELHHDLAPLSPKEPVKVCNDIQQKLDIDCLLVDANDLSVVIFGKSDTPASASDQDLIAMIKDNPAGQSDELTPLILIKRADLSWPLVDKREASRYDSIL